MLELREHMCILCKMCVSQEKAVTQQDVNPDQGSNRQDVCHGEHASKQHPSWFLFQFLPWVSLSFSQWTVERYVSQKTISSPKLFQVFILGNWKALGRPPSISWISLWKGIILGIEHKTSCTPGKHSLTEPKPQSYRICLSHTTEYPQTTVPKSQSWIKF